MMIYINTVPQQAAPFVFLIPSSSSNSSPAMSDAITVNLDDAPIIIEKRGRGHPCGSKNKAKILAATSTLTALVKRHRSHPLGNKKKKSFATMVGASAATDLSLAQPVLPQRSSANAFYFLRLWVSNTTSTNVFL
jgi:hypothetical protein